MLNRKILFMISAFLTPLSLMADDAEAVSAQSDMTRMLVMLGIGLVFFYFILFRPEQKRRKAADEQRSSLKKGDKVNAMGIIGTISKVNETTVILRMVDGAKIEMLKAAVTEVLAGGEVSETDSKD